MKNKGLDLVDELVKEIIDNHPSPVSNSLDRYIVLPNNEFLGILSPDFIFEKKDVDIFFESLLSEYKNKTVGSDLVPFSDYSIKYYYTESLFSAFGSSCGGTTNFFLPGSSFVGRSGGRVGYFVTDGTHDYMLCAAHSIDEQRLEAFYRVRNGRRVTAASSNGSTNKYYDRDLDICALRLVVNVDFEDVFKKFRLDGFLPIGQINRNLDVDFCATNDGGQNYFDISGDFIGRLSNIPGAGSRVMRRRNVAVAIKHNNNNPTAGCDSGGMWYQEVNGRKYAVGIHVDDFRLVSQPGAPIENYAVVVLFEKIKDKFPVLHLKTTSQSSERNSDSKSP